MQSSIQSLFASLYIDALASTKDKAFVKSVGITVDDSSSSEDSEDENNNEYQQLEIKDISEFEALTAECQYNWFSIDQRIGGTTKSIDAQRLINDLKIN